MSDDTNYDLNYGLKAADWCCLISYIALLGFEIFIVVRFLYPLKIKSSYILLFYIILALLLLFEIIEMITRVSFSDPGFWTGEANYITIGQIARHCSATMYILLGFVLSAIMFQLSCSLALVLSMVDI